MARLIEIQDAQLCPSPLVIQVGDVLLLHATGGSVQSGTEYLQLIGPLLSAVLGDDGQIFTPEGAPNTVLFRAVEAGEAQVHVVAGDPWHSPRLVSITVRVER